MFVCVAFMCPIVAESNHIESINADAYTNAILICLGDAMKREKDAHGRLCNRIKIRFDLIKIDWIKRMDDVNT